MPDRPHVLLKCAMSVDGYLDDASPQRLKLSSPEDFARVDLQRCEVDAILVGATTIRKDNPRLMIRSEELRRQRLAKGESETPVKVTVTASGDLDPQGAFFTTGECEKLVYTTTASLDSVKVKLSTVATVVACGHTIDLTAVLADLHARGIRTLMVEGGASMHTQFLTAGLADELYMAIAPFFVGDSTAPRFVEDGSFPYNAARRMTLAGMSQHGDCAVLHYLME